MRRFFSLIRDAWLILGVCLVLLLLANAVLDAGLPDAAGQKIKVGAVPPDRYQAPFFANETWTDAYRSEFRAARKLSWHPYVYWRRATYSGAFINVDERGIRKTANPGPTEAPLILMLGGSTMWGSGSRDNHTIPSRLSQQLADRNISARIINLGERAYVSGQSLLTFQQWLREGHEAPRLVIFYDGVNDVFAALQQGQAGYPQNEMERRRDFGASSSPRRLLAAVGQQFQGLQKLIAPKHSALFDAATLATPVAEAYLETVSIGRAIARDRGVEMLAFWQPTLFSKKVLSDFEQRAVDASLRDHRDLQRATDAAIAATVDTASVIDLTQVFNDQKDTVYMDYAHVSEAANAKIASAMLPYVVEALSASSE